MPLGFSVALFFVSEGLNGISWPVIVGKVIPANIRGRFFGFGQLFSSLGALGAGYVVRLILADGGVSDPAMWALLFGCSFVGLMASVGSMLFIREQAADKPPARVEVGRSMRTMIGYLGSAGWLRLIVAAQLVLGTAAATFPFFVVRARELIPGDGQMIGLFLVMQNLGGVSAALICGQLIDRVGSWASIRLVALVQVAALAAASVATLCAPQFVYLCAFFFLGFVGGSSWWSFSSYLLDMASDDERPIYLATSGILASPTFVSSILVGGLFEIVAPEAIFVSALALSGVGLILAWNVPRVRIERRGHVGKTITPTPDAGVPSD